MMDFTIYMCVALCGFAWGVLFGWVLGLPKDFDSSSFTDSGTGSEISVEKITNSSAYFDEKEWKEYMKECPCYCYNAPKEKKQKKRSKKK